MRNVVVRTYASVGEVNKQQVLRYAGINGRETPYLRDMLYECVDEAIEESLPIFSYHACYRVLTRKEFQKQIPYAEDSLLLRKKLDVSDEILIFAGTVGINFDRTMRRLGNVAMGKGIIMHALAAERAEALCDMITKEYEKEELLPNGKFLGDWCCPGYGDFDLVAQRELVRLLKTQTAIGLKLTDEGFMIPSKSGTGVIGIKEKPLDCPILCPNCPDKDCAYRKI